MKIANASTSNVISYHRLIVFTALRVLRTSLVVAEEADKSRGTCPCNRLKRASPIWTSSAVIFLTVESDCVTGKDFLAIGQREKILSL